MNSELPTSPKETAAPAAPAPVPSGAAAEKKREGRRTVLIRLLGELRPERGWIILSNVFILLSSALGVLSLVSILPFLMVVFRPAELAPKADAPKPGIEMVEGKAAGDESPLPSGILPDQFETWKIEGKAWLKERLETDPKGTLVWVLALSILAALLTALFEFASEACIVRVQTRFQRRMTRRLYLHCLHHDMLFFQFKGTGTLLSHIYNDVLKMSDAVKLTYGVRVRHPVTLVFLTVMLLFVHAGMTLIVLATVPLIALPAILLGRRIKQISRKETGMDGGLLEFLQERLSGVRVIKGFTAEELEAEKFDGVCDGVFERRHKRGMLLAMSKPVTEIMSTVGIAAILLFGVYAVLWAAWMDGETYIFFLAILSRFYKPLKELAQVNVQMQRPLMSAEVVFRLLDTHAQVVDVPDAVDFPKTWKQLEFEDVTFRYGGRRKPAVLKNVSFQVPAGRSTAVLGHNGSGKSTIAALMARFYDPFQGAILVDGLDLRQIRLASLRRAVGICSQEAVLFHLSVAENIAFGVAPEAIDQERLAWAAREAGADRFIQALPDGFQSTVGLRGGRLSGGQRQVLALARMFYHDFQIVVFDEPATHLDVETEECILRGIRRLAEDRTVVLITHDLRHLEGFDHVVVLEKGEVIRDCSAGEFAQTTPARSGVSALG